MPWLGRLFSHRHRYSDLSVSIREHLDEKVDELMDEGLSRDEAAHRARREFGNVTLLEEHSRQVWQWSMLESMVADIKLALRQIKKSPGFAIAVCLTLAVGIGANTAVFSIMDAMMLRPVAIPEMGRMVAVEEEQNHIDPQRVALGDYEDWARESRSFEGLAVRTYRYMNMTGAGPAAHVEATLISPSFFPLVRARPLLGRVFREEEAEPGGDAEAVLSYSFWQQQFGGDPGVLGRRVELDGRAYNVVGVMPRMLAYPPEAELFLPLAATPAERNNRDARNYMVIGRLRPGVTVGQAQAEMQAIAQRLAKRYPATNLGWSIHVEPLLEEINGSMTPLYLRMIMGATAFVLLIVCANVANLQFARGLGRHNEMAVRTALGAGRVRLLRQLLAESVLLGLGGAAVGLILAKLDLQLVLHYMPERVARYIAGWGHVSLNGRALALSVLLAAVAGIVSGLGPAYEATRVNLVDQLKADGRTTTGSGRAHRLRSVFAVSQIALAVALVIGAGLMAKGMWGMLHTDDVSKPKHVLTWNVWMPPDSYGSPEKLAQFYEQSVSRLRALPGVTDAAVTTGLPSGDEGTWNDNFAIQGQTLPPGQSRYAARFTVSSGYFSSLHIRVLSGRAFEPSDGIATMPVAIVSSNLAARYFPGASALGQRIRLGVARGSGEPRIGEPRTTEPWVTIVGVAQDVRYEWVDSGAEPAVYINSAQFPPAQAKYVVVTRGDALASAPAVRQVMASINGSLPLDGMQSYAGYIHDSLIGLLYAGAMMVVDAAIALLLASIGIFGLMANLVGERRREIGVRLTMGARREDVLRLFLRRAGFLTAIGLVVGLVTAAALARLVANLLYGVQPGDIGVFAASTAAIAVVALASAWLPARSASRTDPLVALRQD